MSVDGWSPFCKALALVALGYVLLVLRALQRARTLAATLRAIDALEPPRPCAAGSVVLIVNPISGTREGVATARAICARLRGLGWAAEIRESRHIGHARELARTIAHEGFTHALSVGGDGQLHEVLNGLSDARALDALRVGVVPVGTGNGVGTSLGVHSAALAVRALLHGDCAPLDVWDVESEPAAARPIACALSIGWGAVAQIDTLAERELRWLGPLRTSLIAWWVIARHQAVAGQLWLTPARCAPGSAEAEALERALRDGRLAPRPGGPRGCTHVTRDEFFAVHACNVAYIARDCHMAPRSRPADGWLTVCVVRRRSGRLAAVRTLLALGRPPAPSAPSAEPEGGMERYACTQLALLPLHDARGGGADARFAVDGEPLVARSLHISHALGGKGHPQHARVLALSPLPHEAYM
jgi:diacylglycerol kinase family enzyme